MFHCEARFQQHTQSIRRIWKRRFTTTIGDWGNFGWWWGVVVIFGLLLAIPLMAINNNLHPFPYLRNVYCPMVGDCIPFFRQGRSLPAWYGAHLVFAIVIFFSSLMTQWGYRHRRWCLAWWAHLMYFFSGLFVGATLLEWGLFVGVSGSPIPTALVGYGIPVIYTVWFFSALLPPMRRLWRGERLDFRPPPLKLQAGLGSTVALLGIVGVALGRMFGEMPHGKWGYFAVGVIGTPWLMYLSIHYGVKSLLTLAPWRIVLEAEAREQEGGEGQ